MLVIVRPQVGGGVAVGVRLDLMPGVLVMVRTIAPRRPLAMAMAVLMAAFAVVVGMAVLVQVLVLVLVTMLVAMHQLAMMMFVAVEMGVAVAVLMLVLVATLHHASPGFSSRHHRPPLLGTQALHAGRRRPSAMRFLHGLHAEEHCKELIMQKWNGRHSKNKWHPRRSRGAIKLISEGAFTVATQGHQIVHPAKAGQIGL